MKLLLCSLSLFYFNLVNATSAIQQISNSQWVSLNKTVDGRLKKGQPMAKPCYSTYNGTASPPNPVDCAAVQLGYTDDLSIASHYGGLPTANWGTCQARAQGCNLDYLLPSNPVGYFAPPNNCYQGSISPYYIEAQNPNDVKAAFEFARNTKVPLSIKNSGHDYKGRSTAPDSLALWTYNVSPPITLNKEFTPAGCSSSYQAVTFGAGQNFDGVYKFAEANNVTVVGGSSRTVGIAGGWIAGAGHSPLTPTLGLGVDNVLELKAVLPTGEYVTASRCQNPDIFFALRGGGGGTFGVVMEMTTQAHPRVTLQVTLFSFISTDPSAIEKFLKVCIEQQPKWSSEGWGGYIEPGAISKFTTGLVLMTPKLSPEEAVASMQPLFDLAKSLGSIPPLILPASSYYDAFTKFLLPFDEAVDIGVAPGSRLIPRANFATEEAREELLAAMLNVSSMVEYPAQTKDPKSILYGAPMQILVTTPAAFDSYQNDSAVTPAWRDALWHAIVLPPFANNAGVAEIQNAFRIAHDATEVFRKIAPDSGAYQNEADVFETDPVGTFWGEENYAKLLEVKKKVDPENLLTCWQCVGWEGKGAERYSCYPDIEAQ